MNRIILIGNGFDLAHGLPTDYESFINDLWRSIYKDIREISHSTNFAENNYISVGSKDKRQIINDLLPVLDPNRTYKKIITILRNREFSLRYKNQFLEIICSHCQDNGWHGIEHDYYQVLKNFKKSSSLNSQAKEFNDQFSKIEKALQQYLIDVEGKARIKDQIISEIKRKIDSSFCFDDVSHIHMKKLVESLMSYIRPLFQTRTNEEYLLTQLKEKYPKLKSSTDENILKVLNQWYSIIEYKKQLNYMISNTDELNKIIFSKILSPKDTLLLDFNYTNTTDHYKKLDTEIIHIHGELDNPYNPMIFGYGDEIGEDYKKIEDLEENELLKNVKSIRYQDTNNYQRLMEFIESDYYQVFVMGHSCGNSDRTLLSTLFEHENCLSIKPYFHQYGEKEEDNNYSDIVRNISRNFRDKPAMRNKVVNKTYCEPLLKYKKK